MELMDSANVPDMDIADVADMAEGWGVGLRA